MCVLLFSITAYTQTETVEIPITETERIIDKYSSKVANSFSKFMDTATPMAQEGFAMVVKLKFAEGIAYLTVIPFCLFFWGTFMKYYRLANEYSENSEDHWTECKYGTLSVVMLVSSCVTTVGLIPALYHGLTHVIAPEWYAIKEIAGLF